MKRAILGALLVGLLAATGVWAALSWQPRDPAGCTALLEQAEHASDAGTELEEAGCVEPSASTGQDLTAQP